MTQWHEAGFGLDPQGDAAHARLPAIPLGAALPDGRTVDDLRAETVEQMAARTGWPVELLMARVVFTPEPSEPLVSEPDPHALTRTPHSWGTAWTCACGRWEAVATGRASTAFAEGDYRRHRAAEEVASRGE